MHQYEYDRVEAYFNDGYRKFEPILSFMITFSSMGIVSTIIIFVLPMINDPQLKSTFVWVIVLPLSFNANKIMNFLPTYFLDKHLIDKYTIKRYNEYKLIKENEAIEACYSHRDAISYSRN